MFVVENKFTVLINTSKKHYFIKNWNRISKLFKSMQLNIIFEQKANHHIKSKTALCQQFCLKKIKFLLNNFIIRLYKENRAKHMGKLTSLFSKTRLHYNTLWRNLVYCWTDYGCYLSG